MKQQHGAGRGLFLAAAVLLAAALSGCGHYTRDEAAHWFQEKTGGLRVAVSRDYEERQNEEGYTDYVWDAWLRDYPEIRFELVSHSGYSFFPSYQMETDYDIQAGAYCLLLYQKETGAALSLVETEEGPARMELSGEYRSLDEFQQMYIEMKEYQAFVEAQPFPVETGYSLRYSEPLTSYGNGVSDTGVYEVDDVEKLREEALQSLVLYTVYTGLEPELFTAGEKEAALDAREELRFVLAREDGTETSYPNLALVPYGGMSFGCLFQVLENEGWQVEGSPEEFTFTDKNGRECMFSYGNRVVSAEETEGKIWLECTYYYLADGEEVFLSDSRYCITSEELQELTGYTYKKAAH